MIPGSRSRWAGWAIGSLTPPLYLLESQSPLLILVEWQAVWLLPHTPVLRYWTKPICTISVAWWYRKLLWSYVCIHYRRLSRTDIQTHAMRDVPQHVDTTLHRVKAHLSFFSKSHMKSMLDILTLKGTRWQHQRPLALTPRCCYTPQVATSRLISPTTMPHSYMSPQHCQRARKTKNWQGSSSWRLTSVGSPGVFS